MAGEIVQSAGNKTATLNAATPLVVTLPDAITAGNALLLTLFIMVSPAGLIVTVTGGGVTWVVDLTSDQSGAYRLRTLHGLNSSGGGTQITISVNNTCTAGAAIVAEVSGVNDAFAQPDGAAEIGGSVLDPRAYFTTTYDHDMLWAAYGSLHNAASFSGPSDGFTALAEQHSSQIVLEAGWRLQTIRGGHQPVWITSIPPEVAWDGHGLGLKLFGPAARLRTTVAMESDVVAILTASSDIIVPAAVLDVPDRWLFAPATALGTPTDFGTFAYVVARAPGSNDHPAPRGSDQPWAGAPGEQFLEKLAGGRIVTHALLVMPSLSSGGVGAAELIQARANLDALQALLVPRPQGRLIHVMPDGTVRSALAEVVSVNEVDGPSGNFLYQLNVNYRLADPWFYGDLVFDGPRTVSTSPFNFTITNAGIVATHRPIIELFGPLTNPVVRNLRNNVSFEYVGAIAANEMLLIDSAAFQALLGGASVVGAMRHYGSVEGYFRLEPGDNPIEVTASVTGGQITTRFHPTYV